MLQRADETNEQLASSWNLKLVLDAVGATLGSKMRSIIFFKQSYLLEKEKAGILKFYQS